MKMEGNFSAPAARPSLNDLRSDHKFFGGATSWSWTGGAPLEIGGAKFAARYNLTAGQTYTFVLSGRSKGWSVDRIVLFHTSIARNQAQGAGASSVGQGSAPAPAAQPSAPTSTPTTSSSSSGSSNGVCWTTGSTINNARAAFVSQCGPCLLYTSDAADE